MGDHAKLSPSASGRWMSCPGSATLTLQAEELLGPEPQSSYAAEGSAAHALAEQCLLLEMPPEAFFGQVMYTDENGTEYVADQDMADKIQGYLDYAASVEGDVYIEQKVTLAPHINDVWGTADLVVCRPGYLEIVDLKTGQGHQVDAVENSQLLIYLLGAFIAFDPMYEFKEFRVTVSQPPLDHHSSWELDKATLTKFARELEEAVMLIDAAPEQYNPSEEACRWCRARTICPALRQKVDEAAAQDFKALGKEDLAEALALVPLVKAWISGVEDATKELMLQGQAIPGYKVVEGRKSRSWTDESAVIDFLRRKVKGFRKVMFTEKFVTPAQAEKIIKKEGLDIPLADFIKVNPGSPTLAPESDKRPAMVLEDTAVSDFKEFSDDD